MSTYSQILLHVVYSTKHREPWLTADVMPRVHEYLGGIIRQQRGIPLIIGGVEDHVHMYFRWRTDGAISDLMRMVKGKSSEWIHHEFPPLRAFAWQTGYAAFTVSKSQEPAVKAYIAGQAEHHKKEGFKSELLRTLIANEIEFDERYVFD